MKGGKVLVDYEINRETLALIPSAENITKVLELNNEYTIKKGVNKIMESSCEFFGSSLIGRQKGTTKLIGVTHKAPVIIEETEEIIFFPTTSPRLSICSWISLKNIEKYYQENNKMVIAFRNGSKVELDISYGVLDNQILRATRLESVLRSRKQKL